VLELFDFAFAENGLTAYRQGKLLASQVIVCVCVCVRLCVSPDR
jgi:hypothetical protein